jgi:hypothetical protein
VLLRWIGAQPPAVSLLLGAVALAAIHAPSALAVPPVLAVVAQSQRHPTATFTVSRSNFVEMQIASKPDRATDGSFLQENIVGSDILTDSEIQSGAWEYSNQLDPGTYWVTVDASPDLGVCLLGDGSIDPACSDGYSNVLELRIPTPTISYSVAVTAFPSIRQAYLEITANPLGVMTPYRVCFRNAAHGIRCLSSTLDGFDWNSAADDELSITTSALPASTTFTWYVAGHKIATKRARLH